ncbi:MAG: hypothetical protein FJ304_28125 [Planctomycetes bacterium]|nr:hypothetical protein [Planctomycetota bacterium]
MTRFLLSPALLLSAALPALAQDMPLSQILIDGEGWKQVEGKVEKPNGLPRAGLVSGAGTVVCSTYSPDRGAVFYFNDPREG